MGDVQLHCGDFCEITDAIDDADCIIADPPYYRYMEGEKWDYQFGSEDEYLLFMRCSCMAFRAVLRSHGSVYLFSSPKMSFFVERTLREWFDVKNHILWVKPGNGRHGITSKKSQRKYFSDTERIFFAINRDGSGETKNVSRRVIGNRIDEARVKMGWTHIEFTEKVGAYKNKNRGGASFSWCTGTSIPNEEHYKKIQELFPGRFPESREEIQRKIREGSRVFDVTHGGPNTDVWTYKKVPYSKKKHRCEKPYSMIRDMILTSTREGDTILDPFMGSGVVGVVARSLNRKFIGVEKDEEIFAKAKKRIESGIL